MGYRSDVVIKCEESAFELFKKAIKNGKLSAGKIYRDAFGYTLLYWDWTKWYEDDPTVIKVNEIMWELDTTFCYTVGYGYVFVRLGEDYSDVEIQGNSSCIELPLIHRIDLSGLEELDRGVKRNEY